jgi:S1-C subfamily serine protease
MKKNTNFKINDYFWPITVLMLLVLGAIWTNVGFKRNDVLPITPQVVVPLPVVQTQPMRQQNVASPVTILAVQEDISRVVSMVRPAVVGIFRSKNSQIQSNANGLTYLDPYQSNDNLIGSGIIIDSRGYVLTTFQTVGTSNPVRVTVYTGGRRDYLADVIDVDRKTDLALLKIRTEDGFVPVVLGNSDLIKLGDIVLAIGSPFGFARTVTMGIVSSSNRQLDINGIRYPDLIQTDASINQGNDGGPLVNVKGEVVGINMACFMPDNHYSGIGFAIPINDVMAFLNANL